MFQVMIQWLNARLSESERGAAAVEYGLLVALIAVAVITVVTLLGTTLSNTFQMVVNALPKP
jgi:pilus assembly protein Flp/PilA